MIKIGLLGGTGWVSTKEYYHYINQGINERLGGNEAAELLIYSVNYGGIQRKIAQDGLDSLLPYFLDKIEKLIASGAEGIVLCANTLHYYADAIEDKIKVPLIHIADATAKEIKSKSISSVGLLGTKPTMREDFYKLRLQKHGINTLIPDPDQMEWIHTKINDELIKGIFKRSTLKGFRKIIKELCTRGAGGIILGCTEIPLIIQQQHVRWPLFNTLHIHAGAAVDFMVNKI